MQEFSKYILAFGSHTEQGEPYILDYSVCQWPLADQTRKSDYDSSFHSQETVCSGLR